MKKRLESELISIAHRVLKLKNNSDVNQLYKETQKLYETLSVLKFYQDNFETLKNSVSQEQLEEKLEAANSNTDEKEIVVEKQEQVTIDQEIASVDSDENEAETLEAESTLESESEEESKPNQEQEETEQQLEAEEPIEEEQADLIEERQTEEVSEVESASDNEDVIQENETEESQDLEEEIATEESSKQDFEPNFELEEALESDKKETPKQILFEDFLGKDYIEPIFVKPNELVAKVESHFEELPTDLQEYHEKNLQKEEKPETKSEKPEEKKPVSLNDKFSAGINIGLNDRIAFVKKLFAGSDEDYNRVISQLNTFDTLEEAEVFIEDMVKPDYNDWSGSDEYEARFIELISKKFV